MSEIGHEEHHKQNENNSTSVSKEWVKQRLNKTKRWVGHGVRWLGSELAINSGSKIITLGTIASVMSSNPVPLVVAGVIGGAYSAGGTLVQKDAIDHSNSGAEKKLFNVLKFGQTVAAPVLAGTAITSFPLNPLSSAIQGSVAIGLSLAGSAMGARAFAHRPEGGSKKGGHH